MRSALRICSVVAWALAPCLQTGMALAQSPVTVAINLKLPGGDLSGFSGVSYEMRRVLPDTNGQYYFSPDNKPLIKMFKTLGIKSLRLGGNTADRPTVKFPGPADIDSLFIFARAAHAKIIFTLRLNQADPVAAAEIAKYIMGHYRSDLYCFAIGNEPNVFMSDYSLFLTTWKKFASAITAVAPEARFCGPSSTGNKIFWARDFANDLAGSGQVMLITAHLYPGGNSASVMDVAKGRRDMLSPEWFTEYRKQADRFVPTALAKGLPYRLEEVNSFWNGGRKDVSDTHASALWALDYMYWWASHGASGLNFHTGDYVARLDADKRCDYALFWTTPNGYEAHPISYAFKAFDLAHQGRVVPTEFTSNPDKINITAYSALGADKSLFVTLINKENGDPARDATVTIEAGNSYAHQKGRVMFLSAPQGDVSAKSGVTLGGASIKEDGSWNGRWTALLAPASAGQFSIKVPSATAAVVKLTAH